MEHPTGAYLALMKRPLTLDHEIARADAYKDCLADEEPQQVAADPAST